ncbi:hypothetical protein NPIL_563351 [Nephila pilipes]|uniref:Uncharacterized protein n=1 Tax=Nephila pilipes TaxID=299642 RepID=A0A8X6JA42_NEPPI|nr:hypothetical protein NPIL_563351 [Nephila pilipes]
MDSGSHSESMKTISESPLLGNSNCSEISSLKRDDSENCRDVFTISKPQCGEWFRSHTHIERVDMKRGWNIGGLESRIALVACIPGLGACPVDLNGYVSEVISRDKPEVGDPRSCLKRALNTTGMGMCMITQ